MEHALYKSRRKALTTLLGCAVFVVPLLLVSLKKPLPGHLWLGVGFFGSGMLLGLYGLLDRRPWIVLDEDGVWDRSLRRDRIPWDMIQDAYLVSIAGQRFIALDLDQDFAAGSKIPAWVAWANSALGAQPLNLNISYIRVDADRLCMAVKLLVHLPREERTRILKILGEEGGLLFSN